MSIEDGRKGTEKMDAGGGQRGSVTRKAKSRGWGGGMPARASKWKRREQEKRNSKEKKRWQRQGQVDF